LLPLSKITKIFYKITMSIILAIETSCDDTSAAIVKDGKVLSNIVSTQMMHIEYGGVVPEVASRAHLQKIVPVVNEAILASGIDKNNIEAVAFTKGPGLLGSLLVGVSFAKAYALAKNIPLIEVNHLAAHVLAHFAQPPYPSFPFLCLTVSGGHTQIIQVNNYLDMNILGQTLDDAAGEAFDKAGKMMGLPYPAGPFIDKLAALGKPIFTFPEPKLADLNYSFSGIKTSILYFLKKEKEKNPSFVEENINDLCASIQETIIRTLLYQLEKAANISGIKEIAIAGGVSANRRLRTLLQEKAKENHWNAYVPDIALCTDNAGMIGIVAHYKYENGEFSTQDVSPSARFPLG
jgi:N6-L-threonylcarbamoyladenine synthase